MWSGRVFHADGPDTVKERSHDVRRLLASDSFLVNASSTSFTDFGQSEDGFRSEASGHQIEDQQSSLTTIYQEVCPCFHRRRRFHDDRLECPHVVNRSEKRTIV